jgi:hypothetical protein
MAGVRDDPGLMEGKYQQGKQPDDKQNWVYNNTWPQRRRSVEISLGVLISIGGRFHDFPPQTPRHGFGATSH